MYLTAETLDDLMRKVFTKLLGINNSRIVKPTKGANKEKLAVLLRLRNPRARLSRSETRGRLFSCLGEFMWYLSGSNELRPIEYYLSRYGKFSDDGKVVFGGYGPRLFPTGKPSQFEQIINILRLSRDSRRAVIQLYSASDIVGPRRKDVPCTCTIQFFIRENRLHAMTNMRSNDAFTGLPHDIFAFTMFQEIVARSLGIEIGSYWHSVGSLHIYESDLPKAYDYVREGLMSTKPMPAMPVDDPWTQIASFKSIESRLRAKGIPGKQIEKLPPYWKDLAHLLWIYSCFRRERVKEIRAIRAKISTRIYNTYVTQLSKRANSRTRTATPNQLQFNLQERTSSS